MSLAFTPRTLNLRQTIPCCVRLATCLRMARGCPAGLRAWCHRKPLQDGACKTENPSHSEKTGLVPETDKKTATRIKDMRTEMVSGKASNFGNDYDINLSGRLCCLGTTSIPSADSMENSVHHNTCDSNQTSNGDASAGSGPDYKTKAHTLKRTAHSRSKFGPLQTDPAPDTENVAPTCKPQQTKPLSLFQTG